MTHEQVIAPEAPVDDDGEYTYEPQAGEPPPPVSSYIAIIRIIAVLGMGLCVSFGLFISLAGLKGVLVGIPIALLAIPCYFGMQLAEKLANRELAAMEAESAD